MRMMATLVGVVLAATAACGGNGNGDETASGRAIEPEAQERAESIGLKLTDFPNGWRASTPEADGESAQARFRECMGVDFSELTIIGEAESQDFGKDSAEANSDVNIFEDDQQAEDGVREYSDGIGGTAAEDCFQDLVEDAVREEGNDADIKLGEVDIGELSFTPPENVDEAKAWQVEIPVEITSGVGKGVRAERLHRVGDSPRGRHCRRPDHTGRPDRVRQRPARQARPDARGPHVRVLDLARTASPILHRVDH
jgi:hypothetical protein